MLEEYIYLFIWIFQVLYLIYIISPSIKKKVISKQIYAIRIETCIINFPLSLFYYTLMSTENNLYMSAVIIPYICMFYIAYEKFQLIDLDVERDQQKIKLEIFKNMFVTLLVFILFLFRLF